REYDALETLYPDVNVPQPVDSNRHAIVMERIDGVELANARLADEQVVGVLELILAEMATAYEAGYVHADMSEYNVFVNSEGVVIFDWPQAVPTDHENADELLERDVENIVGYFERKYPHQIPEIAVPAVAADLQAGEFENLA
ncbi:MAG: serine/threonine-protein kinase RIO2, partial [Haloarculaceae archaeon]